MPLGTSARATRKTSCRSVRSSDDAPGAQAGAVGSAAVQLSTWGGATVAGSSSIPGYGNDSCIFDPFARRGLGASDLSKGAALGG